MTIYKKQIRVITIMDGKATGMTSWLDEEVGQNNYNYFIKRWANDPYLAVEKEVRYIPIGKLEV